MLILPNINLELKSALRTKCGFYRTLLYVFIYIFISVKHKVYVGDPHHYGGLLPLMHDGGGVAQSGGHQLYSNKFSVQTIFSLCFHLFKNFKYFLQEATFLKTTAT